MCFMKLKVNVLEADSVLTSRYMTASRLDFALPERQLAEVK